MPSDRIRDLLTALILCVSLHVHAAPVSSSEVESVVEPNAKIRAATQFYNVVATQFEAEFLNDSGVSGPFEIIDSHHFLFVSRCGLATVARLDTEGLHLEKQALLPNAKEVFCADAKTNPSLLSSLPNKLLYGIKGMKLDLARKRLFVHTESLVDDRCLVVKVFEYPVSGTPLQIGPGTMIFQSDKHLEGYDNSTGNKTVDRLFHRIGRHLTGYDQHTCPKIKDLVPTQAGGSFAIDDQGNLYFSIGDMGSFPSAQDPASSYGKIFKFNGQKVSVFALGVRNPEGLFFDPQSHHLLETEHGPKGGDELNEISEGDNLGWPISTYGVNYDIVGTSHFTPKTGDIVEKWGHHDFGKKPLFVYVPAIAPTDLTVVSPLSMFKNWNGSVLIASLRGNSIFRVLLDDGRGMYSEPVINLNSRIRYLRQDQDGTLYAKSDPNLFYVLQLDWPGVRRNDPKIDHDAVILTKIEQCAGCHKPHEAHGIIPNIYGKNAAELRASLLRLAVANVGDEAMRSIAKSLTAEELDRIPVYFSTH